MKTRCCCERTELGGQILVSEQIVARGEAFLKRVLESVAMTQRMRGETGDDNQGCDEIGTITIGDDVMVFDWTSSADRSLLIIRMASE